MHYAATAAVRACTSGVAACCILTDVSERAFLSQVPVEIAACQNQNEIDGYEIDMRVDISQTFSTVKVLGCMLQFIDSM